VGQLGQGMVVVENVTLLPIVSLDELESIVAKGLEKRHTSGTQMNAESSRSHLILSIIIESTNLQTQVLVRGKVCIHQRFYALGSWCIFL
jgi:hypothetical protein